jgi:hypothetical protein
MHPEDTRVHTGGVSTRSKNRRVSKKDPNCSESLTPDSTPVPFANSTGIRVDGHTSLAPVNSPLIHLQKLLAEDGLYEGLGSLDDEGATKLQRDRQC